ncbi:MAG: S8 family serine peptidase [Pseudomonadales bacterium]
MIRRSVGQSRLAGLALLLTLTGCGGSGSGNDRSPSGTDNQGPTARITASTTDGYAALAIDFDGSTSTDPDGRIASYAWDFGDGSPPASGAVVGHTFNDPGGYNVYLTVTDDEGATDTVLQNVRVRGTRLSGTVHIQSNDAVDSDVNDRLTSPVGNNTLLDAQPLPNPVRVGGWVNLPGTGDPAGNFRDSGDPGDFYAITLTGNEVILLNIGDADADLDLRLRDANGNIVDASLSTDTTESIAAPGPGSYFIEVFPFEGPNNIAGGSNYVLSVGQDLSIASRTPSRLSDPFVAGELLIAARSASADATVRGAYDLTAQGRAGRYVRSRIGGRTLSRLGTRFGIRTDLPVGLAPRQRAKYRTLIALKTLARDPAVDHAEVNVLMRPNLTPDDGLYPLQWHLRQIGLPAAWDLTTGFPTGPADVIVAVVDTGLLLQHPDLTGQIIDGYDFISDPSRARDFNGLDGDPSDPGDLAYGGSSSFHGTHVAGTIAARTDNGAGVAGVSWGAKIMPLRALGVDGGTNYDVLQAVRYAAGMSNDANRLPDRPADVINLSLGSPFYSQATQDTFTEVRNRGIIVVASAGNESSATPSYPAAYQGVVSVSATTIEGSLAPYSNYGSTIDVAAPGGYNATDINGDGFADGVVSTLGDDSNPGPVTLGYGALSGTSMAAPHVAGVAALMKAVHPGLTPLEFDTALAAGDLTDDRGAPGFDAQFGYGLINAQKAVLAAFAMESGGGSDPGPVLGASTSTVDLGVLASSQTVRLTNLGSGTIQIAQTLASEPWLDIVYVESTPTGDGLGDYELRVDRSGLTEGSWNATARFVPADPGTNTATVSVTLQVPGTNPGADAGLFYVIAVNEDGSTQGAAAIVAVDNGEYHWVLNDLPAGSYRLFAGSDMDSDDYLCDAGESCGAYRTLDVQERITVDPASDPEIDGLDFVAEFRAVVTNQSTTADSQFSAAGAQFSAAGAQSSAAGAQSTTADSQSSAAGASGYRIRKPLPAAVSPSAPEER